MNQDEIEQKKMMKNEKETDIWKYASSNFASFNANDSSNTTEFSQEWKNS